MWKIATLLAKPTIPLLERAIIYRTRDTVGGREVLKKLPDIKSIRNAQSGILGIFEDEAKAISAVELLKKQGVETSLLQQQKQERNEITINRLLRGTDEKEILAKLKEFGEVTSFKYTGGSIANATFQTELQARNAVNALQVELFNGRTIDVELDQLDQEKKNVLLIGSDLSTLEYVKSLGIKGKELNKRPPYILRFFTEDEAEKAVEILNKDQTLIDKKVRAIQKRATKFVRISNVPAELTDNEFIDRFDKDKLVDIIERSENLRTIFLAFRSKNDAIRFRNRIFREQLINGHRIKVEYYRPRSVLPTQ
eukprot:NODE_5481_length_1009_cov_38.687359_g4910_i0.p1 GENE.NODE_5481_length_1009_cov_38.687359_g4910_i0~~NODE_5481_length_1009_cov_38.687359_g4910_i0.p1  ORF type:complete len:310 (+),score=47.15 NODE_5481_length_1009_cov_38.687359_g4910_i0:55-984(+)